MINKKYVLLAGFFAAMTVQTTFAQESSPTNGSTWAGRDMTYRGGNYDFLDTAVIPKYRMSQHRKFLANQYDFPAQPRNMWELGVGAGLYNVFGDVTPQLGLGLHAHARKAFGYVFSGRVQYNYGNAKGLNWKPSTNYANNTAWSKYYTPGQDKVFYNYKMEAHQLNLDLIATFNNIRFNRARTGWNFYLFAGPSIIAYQTWINATDDNGDAYTAGFQGIYDDNVDPNTGGIPYKNRKQVKKDLKDLMDKSYETRAETEGDDRKPSIFGHKTLLLGLSVGGGMQFRLNQRFNIQVEERFTFTGSDLLDGQRWAEQNSAGAVMTNGKDMINYFSVGLNYNLGNKRKNVEPLYWLNPLDFAYDELNSPRRMKLPAPIIADADNDGIGDQFDKCPGTPAGVAVDSHGCPMDTDGDGVPDYQDKQLITPSECQPVDADGVGKCPDPECCKNRVTVSCNNIPAVSISFDGNNSRIKPAAQGQLQSMAAQMQANPTCKVVVIGNGNGSKAQQQRSWDRVNAIIEYMSEKNGIDRGRFIFQYGQPGDANSVLMRAAQSGEEGPMNVPPPFPNLKTN